MILLRNFVFLLLTVKILGQDIWCNQYETDAMFGFQYSTTNERGDTELKNSSYCGVELNDTETARVNHTADGEKISYLFISFTPKGYISQKFLDKLPKLHTLGIFGTEMQHIGDLSHKNIKTIQMSSCTMDSINKDTFQNFLKLTEIQLCQPKYIIEDYAFTSVKNLRKIELCKFRLSNIKENAFKGLYLTELNLSHNYFEELNLNLFSTVSGLEKFKMSHSNLKKLHTSVDFKSTNFSLDLSYNELDSLDLTAIEVRSLNVSQNKLENLIIGKNCQDLHADNNKINEISLKNSFSTLRNLNLTNNLLGNNLEEICQCVSLEILWLDGNKINDIGSCFSKMTKLEKLSLKGNEISKIHKDSFHPNNNLKFLVLSDNQLKIFVENSMPVFPKLQYIKLNNNKISAMHFNPNIFMPNLEEIEILNNKITEPEIYEVWKKLQAQDELDSKKNSNSNGNDINSINNTTHRNSQEKLDAAIHLKVFMIAIVFLIYV